MKTCKTCRYWGLPRDEYDAEAIEQIKKDSDRLHLWGRVRPCGAVLACESGVGPSATTLSEGERARVVDGSGYYASLRTRDDFGCVLHEESAP